MKQKYTDILKQMGINPVKSVTNPESTTVNDKNIVPLPQKRNYIHHLLDSGFTPTICLDGCKIPFYKEWQKTFFLREDLDGFKEMLENEKYKFNFGVLCGLADFNNVSVIDFDTKQFTPNEQGYLVSLINSLIETEYIQSLILSKKLYIEKSVNNGFHFVVSIADNTERKGVKLLDYSGELKPNNLVNEVHTGTGEFLETRGKKQHFITFPSQGYTKKYNNIWELVKLSSNEYEEFEKYILDYFLNDNSGKFTKVKEHHLITETNKKIRIPKSERSISTESNIVIRELKKYQTTFANSGKDITIITELLQKNGYTLISANSDSIYFTHPNSSKNEPNFSVKINEHYVTSFSDNNPDFPKEKGIGTLTAFYILLGSKHNVNEIIEILRNEHGVKLIRTYQEMLNDFNNLNNLNNNK